jgi:hypothetical protein
MCVHYSPDRSSIIARVTPRTVLLAKSRSQKPKMTMAEAPLRTLKTLQGMNAQKTQRSQPHRVPDMQVRPKYEN